MKTRPSDFVLLLTFPWWEYFPSALVLLGGIRVDTPALLAKVEAVARNVGRDPSGPCRVQQQLTVTEITLKGEHREEVNMSQFLSLQETNR